MEIRHAEESDLGRILGIYAHARAFMAAHGNPDQWGRTLWPPEDLVRRDIQERKSYVCVHDGRVVGTFFFLVGEGPEPGYRHITQGQWADPSPYGVVHRLAGDGSVKGIGGFCLDWAFGQCGHIRIDTHGDNTVMQNLLRKHGFVQRGIVHVEEDDDPRLAFEKSSA